MNVYVDVTKFNYYVVLYKGQRLLAFTYNTHTVHIMKKLIILIGGPGCGKGSLGQKICDTGDFNYIEIGALLRSAGIAPTGKLANDELAQDLVCKNINAARDTVLDGFPRTLSQAEWLVQNFANKFKISVAFINVPDDIMRARIANRKSMAPGRADDDAEIALRRIKTFHEITMPAIDWLRAHNAINFCDIDGTPDIDTVFGQLRTNN